MNSKSVADKTIDGLNIILLALIALAMLFPFYYIFVVSFTSYNEFVQTDLLLWPREWVLDSYKFILSAHQFIHSLTVTIYVTVIGTIFNLFMTATMAFSLSRKIYGQKFFLFLVMFTFIFGGGIVPTYLVVKATGLIDSYWSLIIPSCISSFNLIVIRQFFMNIPLELSEAALIDGANELQIFTRIIIPVSKPALAAFGMFYAVGYWNTYFNALLYINTPEKWTVQVVLRQIVILNEALNVLNTNQDLLQKHPPPPETIGMAAILVATIPILIVYPFLQKHFAKGVMLGSVKG